MFLVEARRVVIVVIGSLLLALSLNFFLIGANVYASGFTGAAQLIASIFQDFLNIQLSTGILLFLFNIPVLILGWFKVGKSLRIKGLYLLALDFLFLKLIPLFLSTINLILTPVPDGLLLGVADVFK